MKEPIGVENFPIAIVIHATDLNNDDNLCRSNRIYVKLKASKNVMKNNVEKVRSTKRLLV